jgi:hypothetical protein
VLLCAAIHSAPTESDLLHLPERCSLAFYTTNWLAGVNNDRASVEQVNFSLFLAGNSMNRIRVESISPATSRITAWRDPKLFFGSFLLLTGFSHKTPERLS